MAESRLHLTNCKLIIDVLEINLLFPFRGSFEHEQESAACPEDDAVEMEQFLLDILCDLHPIYKGILSCTLIQNLHVDLGIFFCWLVTDKGMVRLHSKNSQDHVRSRIAHFIANHQLLTTVLDPETEQLIFGDIGEKGQVLVDVIGHGCNGD